MSSKIFIRYGQIVRELRLSKNISQETLADLCGLHRTYISDVELGKRNVSLENIEKIAKALGVSLTKLFERIEKNASI
ncbi:helix-turn-helix transcriptional regulator [uncultured Selenomonas sp.]|uniref:helix-turn-helix domain-containing protein n=1 Tax=uncultured Selenomonas sp. TaxID=159275 RepID=UPI0028E26123|nr:helix-turn-helix transcriptional regulator [uncultured Selenomonas sp.]